MSIVESIPRNKPLVIFAIISIIGITTVPGLAPHAFHGMHIVDLIIHQIIFSNLLRGYVPNIMTHRNYLKWIFSKTRFLHYRIKQLNYCKSVKCSFL